MVPLVRMRLPCSQNNATIINFMIRLERVEELGPGVLNVNKY